MSAKAGQKPILVAGLEGSGKTSLIHELILWGRGQQKNWGAFKPFEVGHLFKNSQELLTDGELLSHVMSGEPMVALVAPYLANENYPIEMAFRRDGIRIDWAFIKDRLSILHKVYDLTLIEAPPKLHCPLSEDKQAWEWMKEVSQEVIYLINPYLPWFEHNLAQLSLLQELGFNLHGVINNTGRIRDQDLIFYVWEKTEKLLGIELAGMLPYEEPKAGAQVPSLAANLDEHLPDLCKLLLAQ